jgi:pimeloyl-ACP methyl ester carboxylesterase
VSTSSDLRYDRYQTGTADEWLLHIGPLNASPILLLPPLFEELNRTRALMVAVMRSLAAKGHGCWLPDLPGTGESERPLDSLRWHDWRRAVGDCARAVTEIAGAAPAVAAFRGGALLDDAVGASCCWRFAPAAGASLVRDLERSSLVSAKEQRSGLLELAGYPLSPEMLEPLRVADLADRPRLRVLRLASDPGEADHKLSGPALWRRSEPGNSIALATELAGDLDRWVRECAS